MSKIYVGDTGTEIVLDTGSPIIGASVVQVRARKPSGAIALWVGVVVEVNKIRYTTLVGDINEQGIWKLQAYVATPLWTGLGETLEIKVFPSFE